VIGWKETMDFSKTNVDFVTLHNALYYIYTGVANLGSLSGFFDAPPEGFPEKADPFHLTQLAHKFCLKELEEDCAFELKHGITVDNVAERLFHPFCRDNKELKQACLDYLLQNYDQVKNTEGWEQAAFGEENESSEMRKYRMRLFFDISKMVSKG
jgi:hypothetical protein